ncbi:MAG TPA: ATP cone domain-containing protein [Candidatus Nanoarchaeia archaeon]|nr:ATP cone domain-containing protein [Candidatus Nanoarchaeia archaeon]
MTHLIKRKGHHERFDERKLYASIYAAAMANHRHKKTAEELADIATKKIKKWVDSKKHISSEELFKETIKILKTIDKEVAFLYETHRDIY